MIFQCDDLDRALESPELMPDALAHAETCARCRREIDIWNEISRLAPQLHEQWESPALWTRIRSELTAVEARPGRVQGWGWALAVAATFVFALLLWQTRPSRRAPNRELLTDEAFHEVQQAEAAYARSIEKLSAVAGPTLAQSPAPLAAAYREKLAVLDAAIAEVKSTVPTNRYNSYVQTQLASLYREKERTLKEWLENAQHH